MGNIIMRLAILLLLGYLATSDAVRINKHAMAKGDEPAAEEKKEEPKAEEGKKEEEKKEEGKEEKKKEEKEPTEEEKAVAGVAEAEKELAKEKEKCKDLSEAECKKLHKEEEKKEAAEEEKLEAALVKKELENCETVNETAKFENFTKTVAHHAISYEQEHLTMAGGISEPTLEKTKNHGKLPTNE